MTTKRSGTMQGGLAGAWRLAGALTALLAGSAGAAETTQAVGGVANPAGEVRGSARVMGMDASYVGVADGADALQWNPAGLGNLQASEAGWHHLSGLGSAIGESIILGAPLHGMGGLGLSVEMVDNGRFDSRDSSGNVTGQYDARTVGGSLGWGYAFLPEIAVGATLRGAWQTLAAERYDSVAVDVGGLWRVLPEVSLGVEAANLGSSGSTSSLAMGIRAGASWTREYGTADHLLLAAATEIQPGGLSRINLGAEGTVLSRLALRAGYRVNFTGQKLTGLTGLTAGLGVGLGHLALDYAYLPFGELGNLHRVSLTYRNPSTSPGRKAEERAQREEAARVATAESSPNFISVRDISACGFECGIEAPDVLLVTLVDDKTRFDFDADTIKPEGMVRLKSLADVLNRFPDSTLRVDGYSDSIGTAAQKQDISQRRADRVANTLKQMGVSATRFEAVEGRSDSQPIVANSSDGGRPNNRRVALHIHRVGLTNGKDTTTQVAPAAGGSR